MTPISSFSALAIFSPFKRTITSVAFLLPSQHLSHFRPRYYPSLSGSASSRDHYRATSIFNIQHKLLDRSMSTLVKSSSQMETSQSISENGKSESPQPPTAFRDESSFVLAGDLSSTSGGKALLRQSASSPNALLSPPRRIPNPYGWLRDDSRTDPKVLSHLRAENEYAQQTTSHLGELREKLYQEFLSSILETDYTTPVAKGLYWYYTRTEEGVSYPRYCRAPRSSLEELFPPPVNENWCQHAPDGHSFMPLFPGEVIYLDVPLLSKDKSYFSVGSVAISPNQQYVAYSYDESGGETCHFCVRHIASGEEWFLYNESGESKKLLEGDGSIVWNDESTGIFYATMDEAHRPFRVFYRQLFRSENTSFHYIEDQIDHMLLEETDELFNVRISKTFDGKYLLTRCSSKESSEVYYLDLRPLDFVESTYNKNKLVCIAKRREKVLYRVSHCKGYWLVMTNFESLPNLSLKACRVGKEDNGESWYDVLFSSTKNPVFDGGEKCSLDGMTVFYPLAGNTADPLAYGVATGREDGLPRVWILEFINDLSTSDTVTESLLFVLKSTRLEFNEAAFDVGIGGNREHSLPYVTISYDSLVTPPSDIAIPLSHPDDINARRVLKEKIVPGYEAKKYACERTTVKSRDGHTDIPVSLVYHRDVIHQLKSGRIDAIPTHLYGYGSYGASIEASFRATRLPLLKRGMLYAIAHVRGGGEMGRPWYEEPSGAKYLCKMNSFNDFVDVAQWLTANDLSSNKSLGTPTDASIISVGKKVTNPSMLSCEGRSAGGLLIGASINQAPDLFCAAILGVPFVDVACTMTDATIPLTVAEWEEWGNPNEEKYFQYMMQYSPLNNVKYGAKYPACLLTSGLHDPRVQYWEPAKFAAELRHGISKDSGKVLLKTDMEAGHFSASDRYKYLRELAFDYAFLLDHLGLVS